MNSTALSHEPVLNPAAPTVAPALEMVGVPLPLKLKSAVTSYAIQWFAYWLMAVSALFVGAAAGATVTEFATGERHEFSGLSLETYRIFSLQPDHAFTSLAVLVVVVLTLSAGFRDSGVTIEPDVAYVRYRMQAGLLALTGVCCNTITLMLFVYAALNWGSPDGKFQSALLPLALATAVAASLLSIGRERQMELEAMMLHRGILKLERQHRRASKKWDRYWRMTTNVVSTRRIPRKPFVLICLACTALQLLVLFFLVLLGLENPLSLLLAPVEVALMCVFPIFAVMGIVANILRRVDPMERFFSALPGAVYLGCVAWLTAALWSDVSPEKYLPHIALPTLAGVVLIPTLLMPLVRKKLDRTTSWKNYAWIAVHDLQRARELKTEQLRRERAETRIEALKSAWRNRSVAHEDTAK
jgi:hypothetical protein